MGKLRFINNFDTQLSADALPGDTTLGLLDASPLGSLANGDYYCATIANGVAFEVVHITAISGTQITVTRAQEGTTALTLSTGDSVQIRDTAGSLDQFVQVSEGPYLGKNLLDNGNFRVNTHKTTNGASRLPMAAAQNMKTYLNRWLHLTNDNGKATVQSPDDEDLHYLKFIVDQPALNGFAQVIPFEKVRGLRGRQVSLSFEAKGSLDNLGFALLSYTGVADTLSDPFDPAWHTLAGEGTPPLAGSDWAFVDSRIEPVTGNWQRYLLEGLSIPVNANNLALVVWGDDLDAVAPEYLAIREVQLEQGGRATACEQRPLALEEAECGRYYEVIKGRFHCHISSTTAASCSVPLTFKKRSNNYSIIPLTTLYVTTGQGGYGASSIIGTRMAQSMLNLFLTGLVNSPNPNWSAMVCAGNGDLNATAEEAQIEINAELEL